MMMIKSKKYSFGDIILLKFPYTNTKQFKKRPALVLLDLLDNDIIVCRITSKFYYSKFDFEISEWQNCGLKLPSVIRLHKIATLDKNLVHQKIGVLNSKIKLQLKEAFPKLLA